MGYGGQYGLWGADMAYGVRLWGLIWDMGAAMGYGALLWGADMGYGVLLCAMGCSYGG